MTFLEELQREVTDWQDATFGTTQDPLAVASHLVDEAKELYETIREGSPVEGEVADVFILLSRVVQLLRVDLAMSVREKVRVNRERTWALQQDGTYHHV
jgi:NTP pyrophosphatase (non-canonical NTP hydrolase)